MKKKRSNNSLSEKNHENKMAHEMTVPMLTTCVVNKQEIAAEEAEGTLEIICSNNEDQEVADGKVHNVVKIEYEEDAAESIRKVYK